MLLGATAVVACCEQGQACPSTTGTNTDATSSGEGVVVSSARPHRQVHTSSSKLAAVRRQVTGHSPGLAGPVGEARCSLPVPGGGRQDGVSTLWELSRGPSWGRPPPKQRPTTLQALPGSLAAVPQNLPFCR